MVTNVNYDVKPVSSTLLGTPLKPPFSVKNTDAAVAVGKRTVVGPFTAISKSVFVKRYAPAVSFEANNRYTY